MINFFKNFIIAFLMILAVYQTAELWFGKYPNHNFFSLQSTEDLKDIDTSNSALNTYIINLGSNRAILKSTTFETEYKQALDEAVKNTLKKGSFLNEGALNWNEIISEKCLMYKYNFTVDSTVFESIFDIKNNNTSKIPDFDYIAVTPDTGENTVKVSFINSKNNSVYSYSSKKGSYAQNTADILSAYSAADTDIYYISSVYNGFDIFENNVFIPQWMQAKCSYNRLDVTNQFSDINNIEKYADLFFDNPAGKWASIVNNVYTFSDENNVVKFNTVGVLEYSGYKATSSGEYDFYENYLTALQFINKDNVPNYVVLNNYYQDGDKSVFSFDYAVNDVPVVLSTPIKELTGLSCPIEVTVLNGVVIKYIRYGCELSPQEEISYADVDFVSAVDNIYNEIQADDNQLVKKLDFAYLVENNSNEGKIHWIVNINNREYTYCVEQE